MRLILNILYFLTDEVLESRYKEPGSYNSPGLSTTWIEEKIGTGSRHRIILKPELSARIGKVTLRYRHDFVETDRIFLNGYQSWTESREFSPSESIEPLKGPGRKFMERSGDYTFFHYNGEPGRLHGFTYSYIRDKDDNFTLFGSLNEGTGYTIFEYDTPQGELVIRKGVDSLVLDDSYVVLDLYAGQGAESKVFDEYFGQMEVPAGRAKPMAGWTSWYYHYTHIDEAVIQHNLAEYSSRNLPIELFQIDDGWQPAVGDWLSPNDKFPAGMKALADSIHARGYLAGLWLAPFIVEKKSSIYKEHRDWLVTYDGEHLVKAGFNPLWGGMLNGNFFALDLRKEAVRKHLTQVFQTILNEWGFDLVKVDFLYAASIIPLSNKSRGQVMTEAMQFLREVCGEKLILGCGVPLGPSFGLVDYCRIGADTHKDWDWNFFRRANLRERVSTINTLRDSIGRRHLDHRVFLNDPDVFILREEEQKMSMDQRFSLFLVNQIFGSLLLCSDDISKYSPELMQLYRSQFPVKRKHFHKVVERDWLKLVWFAIGDREYFAAINLGDQPRKAKLESGTWFESLGDWLSGETEIDLRPFQSRCFLKCSDKLFSVAGSDAHIFPGSEIKSIQGDRQDNLQVEFEDKLARSGKVYLRVGDNWDQVRVNGRAAQTVTRKGIRLLALQNPYVESSPE